MSVSDPVGRPRSFSTASASPSWWRGWHQGSARKRHRHPHPPYQPPGRRDSRSSRPCSTPSITTRRSVRRSSRSTASTAGVDVARSAYLPRLDSVWQSNRGTANNIFGQVLPQSVIPAMSGPVLPSASAGSVWGSATGALFSWEPFDFGLRGAAVAGAEAAVDPRASRRGRDTSRRADRRRRRVSRASSARSAPWRRCRPTSTAANCSRAPSTRSWTISCGPARKRREAMRNGPRRRRA